jgi:penicillin-binding protein 2
VRGTPLARTRLVLFGGIVASLLFALVLRLWSLQVLSWDRYAAAAEQNRVRLMVAEAPRGRILDRNGEVLVKNRPSMVVSVRPGELGESASTLARLAELLGTSREQIEARVREGQAAPHAAIPVAEDVAEDRVVELWERREEFPGVVAESRPVRVYPHGTRAAHLLGYVGEIGADQLAQARYRGYRSGEVVGRSGVEHAYEDDLRGREGLLKLQVDASGKVRGEPLGKQDPRPGFDVVTTIDLRVQRLVEESLALGMQRARTTFHPESQKRYLAPGAGAVVLDPRNGEVLAMASSPSFDPGIFVGGISRTRFAALAGDPSNPLLNRVTQGATPPGSTFKVVTALAALEEGIASGEGRYGCPSEVRLFGRTFRNWRTTKGGAISLPQALVESCDTVFYRFGEELWRRYRKGGGEQLQRYASAFGLGARTEIDLPFEKAGRVPDERWLKEAHARAPSAFPSSAWLPGYTINLSIGQGDLLATPLQIASAYTPIANGGRIHRPRVGLRIVNGERVVREVRAAAPRQVAIDPSDLETLRRGLEGVPAAGTARGAFEGFPLDRLPVAAKTGTAELPPKQPSAWFVAYAPARDPRYLVAVMMEEAGHGGETAAPVARRILDGLFGLAPSGAAPRGTAAAPAGTPEGPAPRTH